jgi:hypothetical protein
MSNKIPKPRLGYYKALLGYEKPDLDRIVGYFMEWVSCVEYLIFRKENIHIWEKEYKAVKCAKRGNDVYAWKVRKGLDYLKRLKTLSK